MNCAGAPQEPQRVLNWRCCRGFAEALQDICLSSVSVEDLRLFSGVAMDTPIQFKSCAGIANFLQGAADEL